jgi:hypothetical protein
MSSHTADNYIVDILLEAEHGLSELIAEAVGVGDYSAVDAIRRVAVEVQSIRHRFPSGAPQPVEPTPLASPATATPAAKSKKKAPSKKRSVSSQRAKPASKQRLLPKPKPAKGPGVGYPKFEVRNGVISRLNWHKDRGRTESIRCDKGSFDHAVMAMQRLTQLRSGPLMIEDITETAQHISDEGVPISDVHTAVKMLVEHGILTAATSCSYYVPVNIQTIAGRAVSGC